MATTQSRTIWSKTEDEQLGTLRAAGETPCAIAKVLNRSESSVYRRIDVLTAKPKSTSRPCLCFRNTFMSDGSHHRLCGKCRTKEKTPFDF